MSDLPVPGLPGIIILPGDGDRERSPREGRWPWDPNAPPPNAPPVPPYTPDPYAPEHFPAAPPNPQVGVETLPPPNTPDPAPLPNAGGEYAPPGGVVSPLPPEQDYSMGPAIETGGAGPPFPWPEVFFPDDFADEPKSDMERQLERERDRYIEEGYDLIEFCADYGLDPDDCWYYTNIPVPNVDGLRAPRGPGVLGPLIRRQAEQVRKRQQRIRRQNPPKQPEIEYVPPAEVPEVQTAPTPRTRPAIPRPGEVLEHPDVVVRPGVPTFPPIAVPSTWPLPPIPQTMPRIPTPAPRSSPTPSRVRTRAPQRARSRLPWQTLLPSLAVTGISQPRSTPSRQRIRTPLPTPPSSPLPLEPPTTLPLQPLPLTPPSLPLAPPAIAPPLTAVGTALLPLTSLGGPANNRTRDRCECKTPAKRRKCRARAPIRWAGGPKKGKSAGTRCYSFEEIPWA